MNFETQTFPFDSIPDLIQTRFIELLSNGRIRTFRKTCLRMKKKVDKIRKLRSSKTRPGKNYLFFEDSLNFNVLPEVFKHRFFGLVNVESITRLKLSSKTMSELTESSRPGIVVQDLDATRIFRPENPGVVCPTSEMFQNPSQLKKLRIEGTLTVKDIVRWWPALRYVEGVTSTSK